MKNPSVTVAISALNEAQNITAFLRSILSQREEGFVLEKILVISDGSTDRTAELARALGSDKIEVREYHERIGKSSRLNEIYASLLSDILVQSDADVTFSHPFVIRDIVAPIIKDATVGMCGGHPRPVPAITFTERAVNCTFEAYAPFRKTVRGGNNVFSADGRLLAYRKDFVKRIVVPHDMIANDAFTYYCCLTAGYAYRYVETAVVYFRSPQTLQDQIRQNTRFVSTPARMIKYFSPNLIRQETHIPLRLFLFNTANQFLKHPILSGYIFIINFYCRRRSAIVERRLTAKWDMAYSTKRPHAEK